MQKLYILISAFLVASLAAYATDDPQANTTTGASFGNHFPHFDPSLNGGKGGNSWREARLIAKTYLKYNNIIFEYVDSSTYSYSNRRGSGINPEDPNNDEHILFDNSYTYEYSISKGAYHNKTLRHQNFNSNNKVTDLTYQSWNVNKNPPTWWNTERFLYHYDANQKITSSYYQTWVGTLWINHVNSTLVYGTNNQIKEVNSTGFEVDYSYDMNNNLISSEEMVFDQNSNQWLNNERKTYSYNGSNVNTYVLESWDNDNGVWQNKSKWEYQYNNSNDVTITTEYSWSGSYWQNYKKVFTSYDSRGNMIENVEQVWDQSSNSYINSKRETREYNEFDQPTLITTNTWRVNNWVAYTGDEQIRLYYEVYDPTSVPEIAATTDMNIYPMPANNELNVDVQMNRADDVHLMLTDMFGRAIIQQDDHTAASYHKTLSVANVPSGNYVLMLLTDSGDQYSKTVVINH